MASANEGVSLLEVRDFFGMTNAELKREWMALSEAEKVAIRRGIGDGTLTY